MNRILATAALALALVAPGVAYADDLTITLHRTIPPATDSNPPAPVLAADKHMTFVQLGMEMQINLDCHNGGPIHLDDYPLDPELFAFRAAYPAVAHKWAMDGVYYAQSHRHAC